MNTPQVQLEMNSKSLCLTNSVTIHTILKSKRHLSHLTMKEASVSIISGKLHTKIIKFSRRENILLLMGTKFEIIDQLYSPESQRN